MAGAGEDGDRLGPERLAGEPVGHGRLVEPADDQVELARREQGQQLLRAPLPQPHLDVGMGGLEPDQRAGQHARRRHRQGAQRHGAAGAGQLVQLLVEPAQLGEHAAGRAHEHDPSRGRAHAAGVAVEQAELEQVLELVQALGQGGLADPKRRCRLQQAAVRRHRVHRPAAAGGAGAGRGTCGPSSVEVLTVSGGQQAPSLVHRERRVRPCRRTPSQASASLSGGSGARRSAKAAPRSPQTRGGGMGHDRPRLRLVLFCVMQNL